MISVQEFEKFGVNLRTKEDIRKYWGKEVSEEFVSALMREDRIGEGLHRADNLFVENIPPQFPKDKQLLSKLSKDEVIKVLRRNADVLDTTRRLTTECFKKIAEKCPDELPLSETCDEVRNILEEYALKAVEGIAEADTPYYLIYAISAFYATYCDAYGYDDWGSMLSLTASGRGDFPKLFSSSTVLRDMLYRIWVNNVSATDRPDCKKLNAF